MTRRIIISGIRHGLRGGAILGCAYGVLSILSTFEPNEWALAVTGGAVFGTLFGIGAGIVLGAGFGWWLSKTAPDMVDTTRKRMAGFLIVVAVAGPIVAPYLETEGGWDAVFGFSLPTLVAAGYAYHAAPRVNAAAERRSASVE